VTLSTSPLTVSGVSKKFARQLRRSLWYGIRDSMRELLPRGGRTELRPGEFWAVDDVSFELARGEALGIVGGNGAGKSTLLKILFGLLKPDRGAVHLRGRVEALIELGTGFHPQLTGRENIRLAAALHGLDTRGGSALLERVADFAELGDLLDAPLQSYSTGMRARLGYALAAQLEPAVLLVDEVLAVGDLAFQRKCAVHMRGYLDRGGSLLLVSHNTHQIQSICTRAILLDQGRQVFGGTAVETLTRMFELSHKRNVARPAPADTASAHGPLILRNLRAEPVTGDAIVTGEPLRIAIDYEAQEEIEVLWGFDIWTADQWVCVAGDHDPRPHRLTGTGTLTCTIPRLPLVGGKYTLRGVALDYATRQPLAFIGWQDAAVAVDVLTPGAVGNAQMANNHLVRIDVEWG
jgi:lipopolysaccharide transport system ATP-binding protein